MSLSSQASPDGFKGLPRGLSVCFLAYNEADNLRVLLPQAHKVLAEIGESYEIIVVDTASPTDDTRDVCSAAGVRYVPQEYPGFGGAFKTGVKYAVYDKYLTSDSDGSMSPAYFKDIYDMFMQGGFDVVVGSRYCPGGQTHDSPANRIQSKILNIVMRAIIGVKARDLSINFRMHHTAGLKEMEQKMPLETINFAVNQEIFLKQKLLKEDGRLNVGETPISFENRLEGESKRQVVKFILEYIKNVFKLAYLRFIVYRQLNKRKRHGR